MFQSMVEWGVQHQSEQVLILQDNRELEEFQESYQEDQVFIFDEKIQEIALKNKRP